MSCHLRALCAVGARSLLSACAPPDTSAAFHQLKVESLESQAANERFAQYIGKAKHSIHVALPAIEDEVISDVLIDAWTRGREVEVITDIDRSDDAGVVALLDAGVPVTLADDDLAYFDFNLNADVQFPSTNTLMTHTWGIVDTSRALVGTQVGDLSTGERVLLEFEGEDIVDDLLAEHNQVFGGTDATATTAFDGLAKSVTDYRWRYPTQTDLDVELWFGPQQRLVKRLIDGVYESRGSVALITNNLTDVGMARALQDKARYGFPVTAVVGPALSDNDRLSRVFIGETPDVVKRRYTGADDIPTMLITNWGEGLDGKQYDTRIYVLTHDVYSASRIEGATGGNDGVYEGPVTDQLIDGTLWVVTDYDDPSKSTQALYDVWKRHLDAAGNL